MKEELISFLNEHPLFKYELDAGSEQQVRNALEEFFDHYQPERSKREDLQYCSCCDEVIYCRNCNHENTDCKKCKMRCSEHDGNIVREVQ